MRRHGTSIGLVLLALLIGVAPAAGQELKARGQIRSSGPAQSETSRKIVSRLRGLIADFRALGITRESAAAMDAASRFSSEFLRVDATGRVQVYVSVTETSEPSLDILRRHGLDIEIVNRDLAIVQGWVPVENLEALAAEAVVTKIQPPSYGRTRQPSGRPRTGSVNSQGDAIHRCDQVRAMGLTGAGVKVGVISDGVDGLAASQASGDLGPVQVLNPGSGSEGRALLEIIADCAPGAALLFYGPSTSLEFIAGVNALQAAGAQIIVDDLGLLLESSFQDGPVASNHRVVCAVVLCLSAAGNDGLGHYQAIFSPGTSDGPAIGTRHNFGGGDTRMQFRVRAGFDVVIVLQWGNAFGKAGDDYDLYIFQGGTDTLVAASTFAQNGDDDPLEFVQLLCSGPVGSFCLGDIQISLFSGATQLLELFCFDPCTLQEFNSPADSIFEHAAVPEVLAVAASPASNPTALEGFSSRGPVTILFDARGTRLATPEIRNAPALTGTDGVSTSVPEFMPSFLGTSAAAPHVAGVAALVAQANPSYLLGPPVMSHFFRNALTGTAVDLGPLGFDTAFGFGRADALNAVNAELAKARCQISSSRSSVPVGQQFMLTINTFPGAGDPWDIYVVGRVVIGGTVTFYSLNFATGTVGPPNVIQPARPTAPITMSTQSFTFTAPFVAQVDAFCVFADPAATRINKFSAAPIAFTP